LKLLKSLGVGYSKGFLLDEVINNEAKKNENPKKQTSSLTSILFARFHSLFHTFESILSKTIPRIRPPTIAEANGVETNKKTCLPMLKLAIQCTTGLCNCSGEP
jgi:hypothetical protein